MAPDDDAPSLRQRLHAATGDRRKEAEALADRADEADVDDAQTAVRRAHGDIDPNLDADPRERAAASDLAAPADAEHVHHEER